MGVPIEDIEIEHFANYLRAGYYTFTNIMNETGLPAKYMMKIGAKRKRFGVSPGVPDFMIILKNSKLLFIEMKRQKPVSQKTGKILQSPSVVSQEQLKWQSELNKIDNVQCEICYGAEEAISFIKEIEG